MRNLYISIKRPFIKKSLIAFASICISFVSFKCSDKGDNLTTIYGTVTDQNGNSVDSIYLLVNGAIFTRYDELKTVYTDSAGKYELLVDPPKKYSILTVNIPFYYIENPKFTVLYKGFKVKKDNVGTNECCYVTIGEKTNYDFQLIPR
ncbi:carboxypeptidase-like regulatory domain-containing protein [Dyadobacter frigoris]|uniref:Carboxypeptidase regulatory-like domain-containing protein n=1 Tax=Dyadobacter frigoris TaxID=2576211 RepID=A0A4U6D7T7_9BACT|nr:carboxypeptidase-like regulatory domain-containing protein [Dyadobacter frigoris]TKT93519.1 carboxypeptidase regulatory-like domain-containing protein [Dyadobacter frigoris]GLU55748.1 hypothetical protein Dfri01_52090 [Dyadobacter frigoris]